MIQINSDILKQLHAMGLTINEGIAVDARLVQAASRPISNNEIKKRKKNEMLLEAIWIKIANLLNSQEIWNLTGLLKTIHPTMD